MPMIEESRCLACNVKFLWDPAKEAKAARLLCSGDWEGMRKYYVKHGFVITGQRYFDDHVWNYLTHLEAMRRKNVRAESSSKE